MKVYEQSCKSERWFQINEYMSIWWFQVIEDIWMFGFRYQMYIHVLCDIYIQKRTMPMKPVCCHSVALLTADTIFVFASVHAKSWRLKTCFFNSMFKLLLF